MPNDKILETEKTQEGRLWTIIVFSPLLLVVALSPKLTGVERIVLIVIGVMIFLTAGYAFCRTYKELNK